MRLILIRFFYKDILHIYNEDCSVYDTSTEMGANSVFQWEVFCCVLIVWLVSFMCVYKGVKLSSKIVWFTVPIPIFFVFIMVLNGLTLENSDYGIRMYLKG